ncbi:MAG: hypothetical protein IKX00_03610 [Bacilli bacterium]|nr:hypothetical protein [Bacilli bacterium]
MINKVIIKKIIFISSLVLFLFLFNINIKSVNRGNLYYKYIPNYYEKYNDIVNTYDLINENYNFIPAEVINLSILKIGNLFLINKGLDDNVIQNSYVVDSSGLVGIVKKVFSNYSVVELKSSNNLKIAVDINDCYGTLINYHNKSFISDLINCSNVNKGDPVFTSKYSISSSNILVGYVEKVNNDKIYIKYVSNPYKTKYVAVIYDY